MFLVLIKKKLVKKNQLSFKKDLSKFKKKNPKKIDSTNDRRFLLKELLKKDFGTLKKINYLLEKTCPNQEKKSEKDRLN
ncbi:hypothetical protein BpHYR1_018560 [Brachionus plicatilis]|uniref:Uncharacterized protein n=1 Tax=Brachionus plicatilis TaxID=10195 RepID=A0A3M7QS64_BRAPC|nr:hypothetical protein BpHYR1_018560 [Brachionus plicatilis]